MNVPPLLLLTRPEGQSKRLLTECEAALSAPISVVISPIIKIEGTDLKVDLSLYQGVIVTSVNAVQYAGDLAGISLYCVGNRTRIAAQHSGAQVAYTARDAQDLTTYLQAEWSGGKLLYLRGEHISTDIEKTLNLAGIETNSYVIYNQEPQPIGAALRAGMNGDDRAVLPLYSQRSAGLLGKGVKGLGAGLHVIAISQAVADVWYQETGGECEVCGSPDGDDMLGKIVAVLR